MTPRLQHLEQIRQWFVLTISRVFQDATAIEEGAGGSPAWSQDCATFEVRLLSDEERQQVRAAQRPLRGAPVMELHGVVTELARRARVALAAVDLYDASPEEESLQERTLLLVERTERDLITAYKKAVLPKRQGGMFGNVMANHNPGAAAGTGPRAHSLLCMHCGAPRLSDQDFECPYCGQHMAIKEEMS